MPRVKRPHTPPASGGNSLDGCTIAFVDSRTISICSNHPDLTAKDFAQLKSDISDTGGSYAGKVAASTHLVATQAQFDKKGAKITEALNSGMHIVSYDWLMDSLNSDGRHDESNYSLNSSDTTTTAPTPSQTAPPTQSKPQKNGTKAAKRQRDESDNDAKSASPVKKSKFDDMKPPVKKSSVKIPVDDFYMQETNKHETSDKACHVYHDGDIAYDATLNQTNSGENANKFYRIQLLQYNNGDFYTWTRWGRVGEGGQFKKLGNGGLALALTEFGKKFKDKTGNKWEDRENFKAKKGKYTLIDINYSESDEEEEEDSLPVAGGRRQSNFSISNSSSTSIVESKLPKPVMSLMSFIFDQTYFNNTMADLNYDPEKMPLGKLSKKTLLQGYEVLKELAGLIGTAGSAPEVEALSNRYFSLIPHAFGRNRPPVLGQSDMIKREIEVLENLTDMQLANEIMRVAKGNKQAEKLALADRQFQGLGMREMTPLDSSSKEYQELADYLIKSAGQTHYFKYKVQDVFRIERSGEDDRFIKSEFGQLKPEQSDRRLLWHGSRSTNFGGILSQGLRIAPPEAPVSGYMFGKEIYLANISTKSAGYCASNMSGSTGLLLLCEAELGKPSLKLTHADSNAGERAKEEKCLSTWGVGLTTPAGWKDAGCAHPSLEGVIMPDVSSAPEDSGVMGAWLQYDEFICYDVAQVKLRYLIRTSM